MALSWFDNKHKYSTVLILLLFFLIGTFVVTGYLTSDEIQEGFNCPNNSILFLSDETGEWGCANLLDQEVNITVNNVTYIYTNYSLFANYSDYCGVLIDGDDTYVPYTGATGDIDINGYKLYAGELQANSTLFGKARIDGLLEIYAGDIYVDGGWINTTGYMSARDFCINGTECIADSLSYWSESEGSLTALYDLYLTKQVSVNANIIGWENITTKGKFCINTTNPQCIDNFQDLNQSGEADTVWNLTAPYIYNNSGALDFNETKLNNTIDNSNLWFNDSTNDRYTVTSMASVVHGFEQHENMSSISATGDGSFAGGFVTGNYSAVYIPPPTDLLIPTYTLGANITAVGDGSFAWGYGTPTVSVFTYPASHWITSEGLGSFAGGHSNSNDINGSGDGSFTWGKGSLKNEHAGGVNMGQSNSVLGTSKDGGIAIGIQNTVNSSYATAIGYANNAKQGASFGAVALGYGNEISRDYNFVFGTSNTATHLVSMLIGRDLTSDQDNSLQVGYQSSYFKANASGIYGYGNFSFNENRGLTVQLNVSDTCNITVNDGLITGYAGCN